jgi:hypothetical protein
MVSLSALMDDKKICQKACIEICQYCARSLLERLPLSVKPNSNFACYYGIGQHDTYTDHNRYAWRLPARHDKGLRQNGPKIHIIPPPESGRADTQSQDVNQA